MYHVRSIDIDFEAISDIGIDLGHEPYSNMRDYVVTLKNAAGQTLLPNVDKVFASGMCLPGLEGRMIDILCLGSSPHHLCFRNPSEACFLLDLSHNTKTFTFHQTAPFTYPFDDRIELRQSLPHVDCEKCCIDTYQGILENEANSHSEDYGTLQAQGWGRNMVDLVWFIRYETASTERRAKQWVIMPGPISKKQYEVCISAFKEEWRRVMERDGTTVTYWDGALDPEALEKAIRFVPYDEVDKEPPCQACGKPV
nr:uncharacterized protein CI109_005303 [Kwoniella shandongensis]KAA5526347.1 hypothetical protein CI109_005303 [Kwoniella shandongensis]